MDYPTQGEPQLPRQGGWPPKEPEPLTSYVARLEAEIERLQREATKIANERAALAFDNERLRTHGHDAFMAMCAYRDGGDLESFQDAIDAFGVALSSKEG